MSIGAVRAHELAGGDAVADMPPMVRAGVLGVHIECFDLVNGREHLLDLGPARDAEQDLGARPDERHS